jgi:uncharacterized glyoxalase superfamily protein PhnB
MKPHRPKLSQLNIVSGDPAASIAFYRRLGVEINDRSAWWTPTGLHHASATLPEGDGALAFEIDSASFASMWNSGWSGRQDLAGRVVVGFRVASREAVDEIYTDLTDAGFSGLQAPHDAFWGARYAIVQDPDGIAVGLMSPASPEMRSEPPNV